MARTIAVNEPKIVVPLGYDHVVRGFHKSDLVARALHFAEYLTTATIADNDYVGVRITESEGSTNVIEYADGDFGRSQATVLGDGFPFQDNYTIALTRAPGAGEIVTVSATAQPTRTRMMISAAVEGCVTTALPWYCAAALGSDGAALTSFTGSFERPHELKSAADIGVNCAVGPARPSTHSDCVPLVIWTPPLLDAAKGLSA